MIPPAVAIFLSETTRRRVMPRLASLVEAVRYDPAYTIENAFVEELSQAMAKAAERLRPDVSPALAVAIIGDPVQDLTALIRKACPANVGFSPQWICLRGKPQPTGPTFALSPIWRHASIQGGSLDRAYHALIVSLLGTETSRVAPAKFDCLARLRFHSAGKLFRVAIDVNDLPDFQKKAETQLRQAILASYFPEIDGRAKQAAAASSADPLCAAIAQSETLEQAAGLLGGDLQVALLHWSTQQAAPAPDKALADPLFKQNPFPLLHELRPSLRTQQAFKIQTALLKDCLMERQRAELDAQFYDLLPNYLNAGERLAIAAEQSSANSRAARLTVTRHFPAGLIRDTREEILDVPGLSTVLYTMELRPE